MYNRTKCTPTFSPLRLTTRGQARLRVQMQAQLWVQGQDQLQVRAQPLAVLRVVLRLAVVQQFRLPLRNTRARLRTPDTHREGSHLHGYSRISYIPIFSSFGPPQKISRLESDQSMMSPRWLFFTPVMCICQFLPVATSAVTAPPGHRYQLHQSSFGPLPSASSSGQAGGYNYCIFR